MPEIERNSALDVARDDLIQFLRRRLAESEREIAELRRLFVNLT